MEDLSLVEKSMFLMQKIGIDRTELILSSKFLVFLTQNRLFDSEIIEFLNIFLSDCIDNCAIILENIHYNILKPCFPSSLGILQFIVINVPNSMEFYYNCGLCADLFQLYDKGFCYEVSSFLFNTRFSWIPYISTEYINDLSKKVLISDNEAVFYNGCHFISELCIRNSNFLKNISLFLVEYYDVFRTRSEFVVLFITCIERIPDIYILDFLDYHSQADSPIDISVLLINATLDHFGYSLLDQSHIIDFLMSTKDEAPYATKIRIVSSLLNSFCEITNHSFRYFIQNNIISMFCDVIHSLQDTDIVQQLELLTEFIGKSMMLDLEYDEKDKLWEGIDTIQLYTDHSNQNIANSASFLISKLEPFFSEM